MSNISILKRPVLTERTTALTERYNQVAFQVEKQANKYQIRDAVELMYGVRVKKVHTMIMPGKVKRKGKSMGRTANWKKAIGSLRDGDVIDFFSAE